MQEQIARIVERVRQHAGKRQRLVLAVAGAPGSGKSTLAEALVDALGAGATILPMDGYHLDNAILDARGLRARKGAPQTFAADRLAQDLARIRRDDQGVLVPVFDRDLDVSRAFARAITPDDRIIVTEGNYLLLEDAPWRDMAGHFDLTIFLDVPEPILARRLVQRWLDHGHTPEAAQARAEGNDLPNARLVLARSRPADLVLRNAD